jgi:ubiquinone biosynthesis protein UbiJ
MTPSSFFLTQISKAVNAYLALDNQSMHRMAVLENKTMTFVLLPFHFVFQCEFQEGRFILTEGEGKSFDAKLTGTPLQLLSVMWDKQNRASFFSDDLVIEGDAELGQEVAALFDQLHIDWEEYLSQFTGDVPAYHLGQLLRRTSKWFKQSKETLSQNIDEYLHEEANCFPPLEALQDLYNDIDELRMDVDRFEARISKLVSFQVK